MKLFLTRHGQTEENINQIMQGQSIGGKLTQQGIDDAQLLAERLLEENIKYIYSSDLQRAADTANLIGKINSLDVLYDTGLRERSFGEYEGIVTPREVRKKFDHVNMPSTCENFESFSGRVIDSVNRIIRLHENTDTNVLVVSHWGPMLLAQAHLENIALEKYATIGSPPNVSLSVFDISNNKYSLIQRFSTSHLN